MTCLIEYSYRTWQFGITWSTSSNWAIAGTEEVLSPPGIENCGSHQHHHQQHHQHHHQHHQHHYHHQLEDGNAVLLGDELSETGCFEVLQPAVKL